MASEDKRRYQQLVGNSIGLIPADYVDLNVNYLDKINHWEDDNIAPEAFESVKALLGLKVRKVAGYRLLIRLAIIQAFVDLDERPLTYGDLDSYWRTRVKKRLIHPLARALYNADMMKPADICALAGVSAPKVSAHPHNPPPLLFVSLDESRPVSTVSSPLSRHPSQEEIRYEVAAIEASVDSLTPTEAKSLIKARLNQGKFRERILRRWKVCAVTGTETHAILVASHIKPWRDSGNGERLDPDNGLLLVPTLDKLFDLGMISFDDDGHMMISRELVASDIERLGLTKNVCLRARMSARMRSYMSWHRSHIFMD